MPMQDLDHKHILIHAKIRKPPQTPEETCDWLRRLVHGVDMRVMLGPIAHYVDTPGNEGVSGVIGLETSHASIHVWSEAEVAFLSFDLYSCKRFDPKVVFDFIMEFDPYSFSNFLVDRNESIPSVSAFGDTQVVKLIDLLPPGMKEVYLESHRIPASERTAAHRKARAEYAKISRKYSSSGRAYTQKIKENHSSALSCIKVRCQKKGLPYDLDKEWYEKAYQAAKEKYPMLIVHDSEDSFWRADVDRINPTQGYTKDNCRLIPHGLNVAKWKWNKQELTQLLGLLTEELS